MEPIDILKSIVGGGETAETHASVVLITDEFVYKIKKPVYFGFLDYRQLKQRRACCVMEIELNRRFCSDVYLGVLKIVQNIGGDGYALAELDNTLPAVEYVVKMRRIKEKSFLTNYLKTGDCDTTFMKAIGFMLANRLVKIENAPETVEDRDAYKLVKYNTLENFDQMNEAAPEFLDGRFHFVEHIARRFLKENKELFLLRQRSGFVKNGHGDVRAEHIFIELTPETFFDGISLIDCIEFNRRFRTNDILSEAAFLAMELDLMGERAKADDFLSGFYEFVSSVNVTDKLKSFGGMRVVSVKNKDTGEVYYKADKSSDESFTLLNFYRCYRATVRAKVALLTYKTVENAALKDSKLAEYNTLMDLAFIYAVGMLKTCALVFCGMPGAGKTHYAVRFAERFRCRYISSDKVRKEHFGIDENESVVIPTGTGIYSEENSVNIYRQMGEAAKASVMEGRIAVADATFLNRKCLKAFEMALGSVPIYIKFTAGEDTLKKRLAARTGGVSDGRLLHFDDLYPLSKDLAADFEMDTTSGELPLQAVADNIIKILDVN
jgi:aminoglycoside phosphotransferase family enzyme/predicted kinase